MRLTTSVRGGPEITEHSAGGPPRPGAGRRPPRDSDPRPLALEAREDVLNVELIGDSGERLRSTLTHAEQIEREELRRGSPNTFHPEDDL